MRRRTEVVSFRAPDDLLRQIDAARSLLNVSRGDWARAAVQSHLLQSDQQLLNDAIAELRELVSQQADAISTLQKNLKKATYLQLIQHGLASDEAASLVKRNLSTGEGHP